MEEKKEKKKLLANLVPGKGPTIQKSVIIREHGIPLKSDPFNYTLGYIKEIIGFSVQGRAH